MPGTGMCAPIRYTTSASNRTTSRRRRSPNFAVLAVGLALVATGNLFQRCHSGQGAAGSLDGRLGTCGGTDASQLDGLGDFTGLDDLDHFCQFGHETGLLEGQQIHFTQPQLVQLAQSDFGVELEQVGLETTLGQATLQRHLTAFEADLVVTTRTGFLTLVATASGLAQTGANATADATCGVLGAVSGFDAIEFHQWYLREL